MSIYFISDLHLSPERPEITQAFYQFLNTTAKEAESLYILGDFFEMWLGDDDDTPLYLEVIEHLKQYNLQGISSERKTYFMRGNRDFLVGDTFAKRAQVILLDDPTLITYQDKDYLLMHGDSLCTRDQDYMKFRQLARSPEWQQQLLSKTLAERRQYANEVRKHSKTMNSLKAVDIMDVTHDDVVKTMEQYATTVLIHGHTHRPFEHQLTIKNQNAQRIVLGDWGQQGWYLKITDQHQTSLISFDI